MRKSGQTLTVTPSWRLKSGSWARQETLFTLPSSLQFHHQHQQKEPSAVAHGIRDQRVISPLPEGTIRKKDPCFSGSTASMWLEFTTRVCMPYQLSQPGASISPTLNKQINLLKGQNKEFVIC
ncbi:uncharacterized protein LOC144303948 isoform X7 [Canis aureus]